jgi:hypothetical protein
LHRDTDCTAWQEKDRCPLAWKNASIKTAKDIPNFSQLGVDKAPNPWYNNYRKQERKELIL